MSTARYRDQLITALIAFVSAVFGVALVMSVNLLKDATPPGVASGADALMFLTFVFIGIGAYTAWVVTANSVATIVAGRVREIALYRVLGAPARRLRKDITREGAVAGVVGSVAGLVVALVGYRLVVGLLVLTGAVPDVPYRWFDAAVLLPPIVTIGTIVGAMVAGSRVVGTVSPIQALSADVEQPIEELHLSRRRRRAVWWLELVGIGAMLLGCAVGAIHTSGVLLGFIGGVCSFTGVVIGANGVVPRLLRAVGRRAGSSVIAQLARENALRTPRAATRTTIGMIIGVTLVVLFIVAAATVRGGMIADLADDGLTAAEHAAEVAHIDENVAIGMIIVVVLTSLSGLLAGIGVVSNLALHVIQRTREIGVLRAIGMTGEQVRRMIGAEALLTSIVAIWAGLVLGIVYGWVAAQSSGGYLAGGIVWPVVPWQLVVGVVLATAALAVAAGMGPARRVTRESPLLALEPR